MKIENYTFYQGYEGEPEIVLTIPNRETIHIWDGYFEDIYGSPSLDGKGWTGFTRDYQEMKGVFSNKAAEEINPTEYLEDLRKYKNKKFEYDETIKVVELIEKLFEKACEIKTTVKVKLS